MDLRADQFAPEKQGFVRNDRLLRVEIDIVTRPTYVRSFNNQVREIIQQSNMKFVGTEIDVSDSWIRPRRFGFGSYAV